MKKIEIVIPQQLEKIRFLSSFFFISIREIMIF